MTDKQLTVFYWIVTGVLTLLGAHLVWMTADSYQLTKWETLGLIGVMYLVLICWPLLVAKAMNKVRVE